MVSVGRLKKDGKTKYVKLLGKGILDHLFWNLPFCSVKQSQAVRKKAGVTEEEWSTKWEEIVSTKNGARKNYAKITQKLRKKKLRKNYAYVCKLHNLHYYAPPTLLM